MRKLMARSPRSPFPRPRSRTGRPTSRTFMPAIPLLQSSQAAIDLAPVDAALDALLDALSATPLAARSQDAGWQRFLRSRILTRYVGELVRAFDAWRNEDRWLRNACPMCGSGPAMAQLVGNDPGRLRVLSCGSLPNALAVPADRVSVLRESRRPSADGPGRRGRRRAAPRLLRGVPRLPEDLQRHGQRERAPGGLDVPAPRRPRPRSRPRAASRVAIRRPDGVSSRSA